MANWLKFEEQCTHYLNKKFGHKANFYHLGSSDSTLPDIRVITKSGREFYLDAKLTPAQCGQFVLLPNIKSRSFVFSEKNKTPITPQVQAIIDHMNADFEAYKEAGTAGKEIDLEDGGKIFSQWIIGAHLQKGSKFFITNGNTILPVSDFAKHFDVSATYRVKRSGSASVGKQKVPQVISFIKASRYPVSEYLTEGAALYVRSSASLHGKRFIFDGFEYMFSLRGDQYEVRKLSNTFNANVIFSITKKLYPGLTDAEFENYLDS